MAHLLPGSGLHDFAGFWSAGLLFGLREPTVVGPAVLAGRVLLGVPDPHAAGVRVARPVGARRVVDRHQICRGFGANVRSVAGFLRLVRSGQGPGAFFGRAGGVRGSPADTMRGC